MKKLLATLLVLTMLLTMFAVPTMAEDTTPPESAKTHVMTIPAAGETGKQETRNGVTYDVVTYNSKEYIVIRTVEQFLKMDDDGIHDANNDGTLDRLPQTNVILANDIDFTGVTLTPVNGSGSWGVITGSMDVDVRNAAGKLYNIDFEGNGYALNNITLNVTESTSGLFVSHTYLTNSFRHLTLNNVTFEGKTAGKHNCGIIFGQLNANSSVEFKYVDINVKSFKANGNGYGAFIGRNAANGANGTTFVGCNVTGTFDFTNNNCHNGAFIGQHEAASKKLSFTDCHFDGKIESNNNRQGGFVGQLYKSGDVTFTNCTSKGTFTEIGGKGLAGFIGGAYQAGKYTFTNCTVEGTITGIDQDGAFIGWIEPSTGATVNFTSCALVGKVITNGAVTNAYIGNAKTNTVTYTTCKFPVAEKADGTPAIYSQTASADGYSNVRVVMCVKAEYLTQVTGLDIQVKFGLTAGGAKALNLGMASIKTYSSVMGDGNEYIAPEGYVLMAVVVTDIDETEWDKTLTVTIDADGNENVNKYYDYPAA